MRAWLGCSLITVGLLASACADSPAKQIAPFEPGGGTTGGAPGPTTGVDMPTNGNSGNSTGGNGAKPDGGSDAGPQCIVPVDAPRGFHCNYINRVATGVLVAPDSGLDPIKGCKDFPVEVSEADALASCNELFPILEGSAEVSAGPCDMTGAMGFCSDSAGGRDFTYHAACDIESSATGDGSWACDTFGSNFGATGWTCLGDETKSWGGDSCTGGGDGGASDGGSEPSKSCDELPTGDGKTYSCNYTNGIASSALKHDVLGCKQYGGTWTKEDAEKDCKALTQADKAKAITFAESACSLAGTHGHCQNSRGDGEYSYEGGCNPKVNTSGAWACETFGIGGQDKSCASWTCAGKEPDRSCQIQNPGAGKPGCRNFPFDTTETEAKAYCDPAGGTVKVGFCETSGSVGTCTDSENGVDIFTSGLCPALETACETTAGSTFLCLKEPEVWSCQIKDTGLGCTWIGGDCEYCTDYAESEGWTEATAKAECEKDSKFDQYGTFGTTPSCEDGGYTDRCVNDDGTRGYGDGKLGNDCDGTEEPVQTKCEPVLTGIITCRYTDPNANGPACIDYPTKDWTQGEAMTHCTEQAGANSASVALSSDGTKSCIAVEGASAGDRCASKLDAPNMETWYGYGVPGFVCSNFLSGTGATGPFCQGY